MNEYIANIHLALPELIILATACVAILADLFLTRRFPLLVLCMACIGLLLAGLVSYMMLGQYASLLFNGLFISDDMGQLMKIFVVLTVLLCFIYSRQYIDERMMPAGDYYVLGLFSTLGMMSLISAHSLLTLYLGLELLSLPLYALVAVQRNNSNAAEASVKYFVMGAMASGILLFGMSFLYGATGQLDLVEIANAIHSQSLQNSTMLAFAMVFIITGVGFKLAAIPFHMWAPDVYAGAPTSVTLFISAAPKIAALAMTLRLLSLGLGEQVLQWQPLILILALLSTALGNLLAVVQTNLKRLFAYSAISHMGYALFGVLAADTSGYAASLYYVLIYSLMSAAAFGLLVLMSRTGQEIELVEDLKGLNKRNPWLAFLMMIVLFSMAGVPPTVGFFAKLLVLKALVDVHMTWVAVLGLLFAVIGAFYYLRIIKVMYFDESGHVSPIKLPKPLAVVFSVNCLSLLYLGIFPGALIAACMNAFSG